MVSPISGYLFLAIPLARLVLPAQTVDDTRETSHNTVSGTLLPHPNDAVSSCSQIFVGIGALTRQLSECNMYLRREFA